MLIVNADHTLVTAVPEQIWRILELRRELIDLATFIIVAPGDPLTAIETAVGFPISPEPPWEWVLDHGDIMEAPIILSDDGFAVVLIVPDEQGVDPVLLMLLRRDAVAANQSANAAQPVPDIRT